MPPGPSCCLKRAVSSKQGTSTADGPKCICVHLRPEHSSVRRLASIASRQERTDLIPAPHRPPSRRPGPTCQVGPARGPGSSRGGLARSHPEQRIVQQGRRRAWVDSEPVRAAVGVIGFAIPNEIGTPASPGRAEQRNGRLPLRGGRFVWVPGRAEHVQAQAKTRCANLPRVRHSSPGTIARTPLRANDSETPDPGEFNLRARDDHVAHPRAADTNLLRGGRCRRACTAQDQLCLLAETDRAAETGGIGGGIGRAHPGALRALRQKQPSPQPRDSAAQRQGRTLRPAGNILWPGIPSRRRRSRLRRSAGCGHRRSCAGVVFPPDGSHTEGKRAEARAAPVATLPDRHAPAADSDVTQLRTGRRAPQPDCLPRGRLLRHQGCWV